MFLILSILAGFMVALMIQLNGILQESAGALSALLSIHLSGLAASVFLVLVIRNLSVKVFNSKGISHPRGNKVKENPVKKTPWYYLFAGMIGTAIVFLGNVSFLKGGILVSLSGFLAGQTLAATITESFYSKEREKTPLIQRLLTPVFLIPGSLIIGLKENISLIWVLISWLPGFLLMIQQNMNAGNTIRWGLPKTVLFNFISALGLIIPLYFLSSAGKSFVDSGIFLLKSLDNLPWYIFSGGGLIGVVTTGLIALLLLEAPALMVTMGIYTGELAGGIILDLYGGNPLAPEKILAVLLLAAGLSTGKISMGQRKIEF